MVTATESQRDARKPDPAKEMLVRNTTEVLRAFMECSDEIQKGVLKMAQIIDDPNADEDEKAAAADTLIEALYPIYVEDGLGMDSAIYEEIERSENPETEQALDEEEAAFSRNLSALMEKQGMTQAQLAVAMGIGQPAVSMMLSRNCRPQQGTLRKAANALGVEISQLWPSGSK